MYKITAATDGTLAVVSSRNFKNDGITATATKFHWDLTHLIHATQYKRTIGQ